MRLPRPGSPRRAWWAAGHAHRRRVLLKAHDLLLERRDELLDILQTESGKTRGQAFEEVFQGANITRYSALGARRALATKRRRAGIPLVIATKVTYQPKGAGRGHHAVELPDRALPHGCGAGARRPATP